MVSSPNVVTPATIIDICGRGYTSRFNHATDLLIAICHHASNAERVARLAIALTYFNSFVRPVTWQRERGPLVSWQRREEAMNNIVLVVTPWIKHCLAILEPAEKIAAYLWERLRRLRGAERVAALELILDAVAPYQRLEIALMLCDEERLRECANAPACRRRRARLDIVLLTSDNIQEVGTAAARLFIEDITKTSEEERAVFFADFAERIHRFYHQHSSQPAVIAATRRKSPAAPRS